MQPARPHPSSGTRSPQGHRSLEVYGCLHTACVGAQPNPPTYTCGPFVCEDMKACTAQEATHRKTRCSCVSHRLLAVPPKDAVLATPEVADQRGSGPNRLLLSVTHAHERVCGRLQRTRGGAPRTRAHTRSCVVRDDRKRSPPTSRQSVQRSDRP